MPRPVSVCHACGTRIQRKNPKFCPECQAPLNADEYQKWLEAGNKPMPDGWKKPEPTTPKPDTNNEEETDMDKNNHNHFNPWWIILLIAIIIAIVAGYAYFDDRNDKITEQEQTITDQNDRLTALEAQVKNPAANYVYVPDAEANAAALTAAANGNYDGWAVRETKDLQPGWSARGDVTVLGTKYYDEGGVNEASVIVNRSANPIKVYSEWGAGEVELLDYSNRDMAKQELDNGGDPDASSVRIVEFTDNEVVETWYRYKGGIVTLIKTLVHDR